MAGTSSDQLLIESIRRGDEDAWRRLIERYEGRIRAFVRSRLKRQEQVDDVVQETFIGLLRSLPHYDASRSLESYLFSIAHYKVIDALRSDSAQGEDRPAARFGLSASSQPLSELAGPERRPSSIVRSKERREVGLELMAEALQRVVKRWLAQGKFERLKCLELIHVCGYPNKRVANVLGISEQAVAVHKHRGWSEIEKELSRLYAGRRTGSGTNGPGRAWPNGNSG